MSTMSSPRILTINTGSSSLKAGLYRVDGAARLELAADLERIGRPGSRLRIQDPAGETWLDRPLGLADHPGALRILLDWLAVEGHTAGIVAVAHRVVHGGRAYTEPQVVTPELLAALRDLSPIDPEHLPQAIAAIDAVAAAHPALLQIACFDTAFHRRMPRVAQIYPLPRELEEAGVLRYGFHGLSYESIVRQLRILDGAAAGGQAVVAHLGNGASMAALRDGVGVETTMGFTPTGGLMMGTRSGDLDPGVLLYLLQVRGMGAAALNALVNRQSGLLGVSGSSGDMRDLLARETDEPRAADAVALFCYQAKKFLGALVAALGGLDTLVFTGGIGEHAAPIRARICAGLEFLGIGIDDERNRRHAPVISRDGRPVTVRVLRSDEADTIVGHAIHVLRQQGVIDVPV